MGISSVNTRHRSGNDNKKGFFPCRANVLGGGRRSISFKDKKYRKGKRENGYERRHFPSM